MSLLKRIHLKGEIKDARIKGVNNKPVSQSCAVAKSEKFWRATGQSNLAYKRLATAKSFQSLVFVLTQLLMKQSSILSVTLCILFAKFGCPVAFQNFSLLATAHDCETGVLMSLRS